MHDVPGKLAWWEVSEFLSRDLEREAMEREIQWLAVRIAAKGQPPLLRTIGREYDRE